PHVAARPVVHRLPSRDGSVHAADRRGLCLPLLDHRHRADRRRPAGDDALVPVAATAALSPDGESGLQRRGEDPTDRVLLGAQASGRPRPLGPARPRGPRLPLLPPLPPPRPPARGGSPLPLRRVWPPLGPRGDPAPARFLGGPRRPGGWGFLFWAPPPILAALVGAAGPSRSRRGLRRPHRAPSTPADSRTDG